VTIPVLTPPTQAELAVPYLTPAGFTAYPTWLDLDNLIPGGVAALQEDELAEALLSASSWAIGVVDNMPLHGHWVQNENLRTRAGGGGRVFLQPRHVPVRAITALSWGGDPSCMQADSLPDPSMWVEDGREVSFRPGGGFVQFSGPALQFGPALRPQLPVYVTWSYVAGFPNAVLSAVCESGAESVTVSDPTSVLPGDVLRIYDAGDTSATVGASEALTVASDYVPALPTIPPVATAIPLAGTTQYAHDTGIGITGFPRRALQAVIAYTVALLMRDDTSAERPATGFGPAAEGHAGGEPRTQPGALVAEAAAWLYPYAPVMRS
jgi:hypothetical protein